MLIDGMFIIRANLIRLLDFDRCKHELELSTFSVISWNMEFHKLWLKCERDIMSLNKTCRIFEQNFNKLVKY